MDIVLTQPEFDALMAEVPVMIEGAYLISISEAQVDDMFDGGVEVECELSGASVILHPPGAAIN